MLYAMLICRTCKEEKSLDEFPVDKSRRKNKRHNTCKECRNKVFKQWYMKTGKHKLKKKYQDNGGKKRCSKCKKRKWRTEYYKSTIEPDGRFDLCKKCCKTHPIKRYILNEDKKL